MNNQEKYKDDILRQYINPERIEKAPEGFTSEVMTRIRLETQPSMVAKRSWKISPIPAISVVVTILLLTAAFLIPVSESDSLALPVLKLLKSVKSSFPELNLSSIFRLTFPSVIIYVFTGILILTFFDRALYRIFYREK
jgi:hypothetical protein